WLHLPDRVPAPARLQEITRCVTIRCHRGPMANEAARQCRRQIVSLNKPVRGSVCLKSVRFAGGQPSGLEIGGELCCMETTMKPLTLLLVVALAPALLAAKLWSAEGKSPKANAAAAGEDLFARPKVYRLKIELSDSAREALRKEPRHYVKATIHEGSQVYQDAGVRLKGNTSF